MNSFYWFHLLFLFILLLPVLSFSSPFGTLAPFLDDPAGYAGSILLYLLYAAAVLGLCPGGLFSLLWNPGFLAAGFRNPTRSRLRFHLSHGGVLPDPLDRRGGAQKKAVITIFLGIYPFCPKSPVISFYNSCIFTNLRIFLKDRSNFPQKDPTPGFGENSRPREKPCVPLPDGK